MKIVDEITVRPVAILGTLDGIEITVDGTHSESERRFMDVVVVPRDLFPSIVEAMKRVEGSE